VAAHTLIASTPNRISLPRQPFALRYLARDTQGHVRIQLRDQDKPRNDDKETPDKAQLPREHQKQREPQGA
jgi:hypothetical protein